MTKFEKAGILGWRASQISKGSPIYVNLTNQELTTLNPLEIAEMEFKEKVMPFILRRIHADGRFEDWSLK